MENKQVISRQAVLQVLRDYAGQYRKYPLATAVGFLAPAAGTILIFFVPPLIVGKLINTFAAQGSVSLSSVTGYIALFGGSWFLGEAFFRLGLHGLIKLEARGITNLGKLAFNRLMGRDYDFYANNFVGSLTKKTMAYARGFETFTDVLSFNILTNVIPVFFALVVLWNYSPWISYTLLALIVLGIIAVVPLVRARARLVALRHDASSKVSGRLSDVMTNMLAVKSFAAETREEEAYGQHVETFSGRYVRAANYQNLRVDMVIAPFYIVTNVIGLIAAVFFAQKLNLQAGVIVVVFSYYAQVTRIFWEINRVYRQIESSISEAAEMTQLFVGAPKVSDVAGALPLSPGVEKGIRFEAVDFKYGKDQEGDKLFLKDFNLYIEANQRVGLVGPSGGGKTTITKLLLRFIDAEGGKIAIDGRDISKVTQVSLREHIGYVPQEPLLFHRSLRENIAYGNSEATDEEVMHAAKLARADEFISDLPQGYETLVGERGIKLSGGQRQRIAIARAILKQAPILVLDEATSSLDSESEKYIQEGLKELMKGKTALVIAHRLSTIKHLDRILVLDKGVIVQDGSHDELIKKPGLYAKLWSHQSGEFLADS